MKKFYLLLFTLSLLLAGAPQLRAQDPEFTQFYANPLYLNPALAGTKVCPRISLNYRNQWPGISGTYVTYATSYDQYIHNIKGGIGVTAFTDQAGQGTLNTTGVGAIYNNHLPIKKNVAINTAIQVGYWQKALNWDKLSFGDQIDPARGFINYTNETPGLSRVTNFDVHAGMVLTITNYYVGGAVHHILEPNESLLGGNSILPRKYTFHAGGLIHFNDNDKKSYISPNILFQKQQDFQQLNLGLYVKKDMIVGGLWYRNADSFIILLGIEDDLWRIGYSYDVTVSKLTNATAGSHEISLGKSFTCKKPKPRYRVTVCPSF